MRYIDWRLKLGEDPQFDRMLAAGVRYGEIRIREKKTPGEIQLELTARGVDEQVTDSILPYLEILHDRRLIEDGFKAWMDSRPITSTLRSFSQGAALVTAALIVVSTALLLGLDLDRQIAEIGIEAATFLIAPFLLYGFTWAGYWVAKLISIPRAQALQSRLAQIEGSTDPGSAFGSAMGESTAA